MKTYVKRFWMRLLSGLTLASILKATDSSDEAAFATLNASAHWQEKLNDPGTSDWRQHWFLDGEIATVETSAQGTELKAGPTHGDDAHHAVLWTHDIFTGDLKVEFDYTRTDTAMRNVNIIFLQASGVGEAPYVEDIAAWSDLRKVPSMRSYFDHMNLLHISFAAFNNQGPISESDYVRARRYPTSLAGSFEKMEVPPTYDDTGLFKPGVTYHIITIKTGQRLFFQVSGDGQSQLFAWDVSKLPPLPPGRVGLRHMFTRSAAYRDLKISTAPPQSSKHVE